MKPYTYEGECVSECPYLYIPLNGLCVPNLKLSNINETFEYSNMNIEEMNYTLKDLIIFIMMLIKI